jgi:hypothetical protein
MREKESFLQKITSGEAVKVKFHFCIISGVPFTVLVSLSSILLKG